MGFFLTHKALSDLEDISIYTRDTWGKAQRDRYIREMDETFHLLATHPETGTVCNAVKQGYRKFPKDSHVIFYRQYDDKNILIVRILHKKMDAPVYF